MTKAAMSSNITIMEEDHTNEQRYTTTSSSSSHRSDGNTMPRRRSIFSEKEKNVGIHSHPHPSSDVEYQTFSSEKASIPVPEGTLISLQHHQTLTPIAAATHSIREEKYPDNLQEQDDTENGDNGEEEVGLSMEYQPILLPPIGSGNSSAPFYGSIPNHYPSMESQTQSYPPLFTFPSQQVSSSLPQALSQQMPKIPTSNSSHPQATPPQESKLYTFSHDTHTGRILTKLSSIFLPQPSLDSEVSDNTRHGSAFAGFLSLLLLTCANNMLSPMRDAAALAVGVSHIPNLTLASTLLALCSAVPMGWLFEAPNPERKGRRWRDKIGLTRGETQGTSLALFYRVFAILLLGYAAGFKLVELFHRNHVDDADLSISAIQWDMSISSMRLLLSRLFSKFGTIFYIAFYLVGNLMKLHSVSLLWGVTSEAMEYEEQAEQRERKKVQLSAENCDDHHSPFGSDIASLNTAQQVSLAASEPLVAKKECGGGKLRGKQSR